MVSDKIIYWLGRFSFLLGFIISKKQERLRSAGAQYGVRPARPSSYREFEEKKAAATACRHYSGLI